MNILQESIWKKPTYHLLNTLSIPVLHGNTALGVVCGSERAIGFGRTNCIECALSSIKIPIQLLVALSYAQIFMLHIFVRILTSPAMPHNLLDACHHPAH